MRTQLCSLEEIWEGDAGLDLEVFLKNDGGGVGNEITLENPG